MIRFKGNPADNKMKSITQRASNLERDEMPAVFLDGRDDDWYAGYLPVSSVRAKIQIMVMHLSCLLSTKKYSILNASQSVGSIGSLVNEKCSMIKCGMLHIV